MESLLVITLLHDCLAVVGLNDLFLEASSGGLVLLVNVIPVFLVNLEENDLEVVLLLEEIKDLEVLLVEFGLRLQNK